MLLSITVNRVCESVKGQEATLDVFLLCYILTSH